MCMRVCVGVCAYVLALLRASHLLPLPSSLPSSLPFSLPPFLTSPSTPPPLPPTPSFLCAARTSLCLARARLERAERFAEDRMVGLAVLGSGRARPHGRRMLVYDRDKRPIHQV